MIPTLEIHGAPYERGFAYGAQAKDIIARSIELYRRIFEHNTGMTWSEACTKAREFQDVIRQVSPSSYAEMHGIADGAGVAYPDVLALNCRSELMFGAGWSGRSGECSSFAVAEGGCGPARFVGQNWDWNPQARGVVVLLRGRDELDHSYLTIVEAGMLAKIGANSQGLILTTNTLLDEIGPRRGLPYHVVLRDLLACDTVGAAKARLLEFDKALSANYLVADRTGIALDLETSAGAGPDSVQELSISDKPLCHTNHFISPTWGGNDIGLSTWPDSALRLAVLMGKLSGGRVSIDKLRETLSDHENYPSAVCSHPDEREDLFEQGATIASVIFDLRESLVYIALGNPCVSEYLVVDAPWAFECGARSHTSSRRA